MKKKIILLLVLTLLLAALGSHALYGEEITEFLFPVRNDWVEKEGVVYYHDEDGDPVTGWFLHEGSSYYLDPARDGAMVTGWLEIDGSRYYLDEQGHLRTGWQEIDGKTYYLLENGAVATGKVILEEGTFYLTENGTPCTGWLEEGGETYCLNDNGMVSTGWLEIDGGRYYFDESGARQYGWLELEDGTYYLDADGLMVTGWLEADGTKYYLDEDGHPASGWLDTEGSRYYLKDDGSIYTGWLDEDNKTYYFQEDGAIAAGRIIVDDAPRYFTSSGEYVILVNRWNQLPADYETELVDFNGWQVDSTCYDALVKMLSDCPYDYTITSAYRSQSGQQSIWDTRLADYQANGYSYEGALALVEAYVAVPGTSEHQLGLAVDISGAEAQGWLNEHCWEYGFILRYPDGKSEITGIAFERWHFRYVGVELAMEMKGTGLCLEEYLDQMVNDGTTASNPENVKDTKSEAA